jgi:hypothetical protein
MKFYLILKYIYLFYHTSADIYTKNERQVITSLLVLLHFLGILDTVAGACTFRNLYLTIKEV